MDGQYWLLAAGCWLLVTGNLLNTTTYCLLPNYYCLLPKNIANCLLATAHHDEGRGLSRQPPLEPLVLGVVGEESVALPHLVEYVARGEQSAVGREQ